MNGWNPLEEKPKLERAWVRDVEVRAGSRVRLWPQLRADILDMALEGKSAVVEAIEQDYDGCVHLAVMLDDDPGKDLGLERQPGHRFFFRTDEVEPLGPEETDAAAAPEQA
jgi:hypothetical protein